MDREEFLEKARKANEEMASKAKLSDLANPNSIIYGREGLKTAPSEVPKYEAPKERPTVDAEGLPILERVHTFAEDIQDAVADRGLSMSKIALEEGKAAAERPEETKPPFPWKKVLMFTLIILFVLAGGAAGIYSYLKKKEEEKKLTPVQVEPIRKEFIEAREFADVTPRRMEKRFLLEGIEKELEKSSRIDSLRRINLKDENGVNFDLKTLLTSLEAEPPEAFLRSLSSTFYLYIYRSTSYQEPVLILFSSSFDAAYPGMLEWESYLPFDMEGLYGFLPKTATTTERVFKDRIIENKDVRVLYNDDGTFKFFYPIVENRMIIFARSQSAFEEVLKRIREAKLIQ